MKQLLIGVPSSQPSNTISGTTLQNVASYVSPLETQKDILCQVNIYPFLVHHYLPHVIKTTDPQLSLIGEALTIRDITTCPSLCLGGHGLISAGKGLIFLFLRNFRSSFSSLSMMASSLRRARIKDSDSEDSDSSIGIIEEATGGLDNGSESELDRLL